MAEASHIKNPKDKWGEPPVYPIMFMPPDPPPVPPLPDLYCDDEHSLGPESIIHPVFPMPFYHLDKTWPFSYRSAPGPAVGLYLKESVQLKEMILGPVTPFGGLIPKTPDA